MRTTQDYTGSYVTAPESYAMQLVRMGMTPAEYWHHAYSVQPLEYIEDVLFELGQLPTTEEFYS